MDNNTYDNKCENSHSDASSEMHVVLRLVCIVLRFPGAVRNRKIVHGSYRTVRLVRRMTNVLYSQHAWNERNKKWWQKKHSSLRWLSYSHESAVIKISRTQTVSRTYQSKCYSAENRSVYVYCLDVIISNQRPLKINATHSKLNRQHFIAKLRLSIICHSTKLLQVQYAQNVVKIYYK